MATATILWTIGGESDIELPEQFNSESDWREVVAWIDANSHRALDPGDLLRDNDGWPELVRWEFDGVND